MIWDHKSVFGFSQRNAPLIFCLAKRVMSKLAGSIINFSIKNKIVNGLNPDVKNPQSAAVLDAWCQVTYFSIKGEKGKLFKIS